jgi:hypothetical protein
MTGESDVLFFYYDFGLSGVSRLRLKLKLVKTTLSICESNEVLFIFLHSPSIPLRSLIRESEDDHVCGISKRDSVIFKLKAWRASSFAVRRSVIKTSGRASEREKVQGKREIN